LPGSAVATTYSTAVLDVHVVDVLLGFDGLASGLPEDVAEFGGRLIPLGASDSFGADDEFAVSRDGDD
jgi:hypothetical protein